MTTAWTERQSALVGESPFFRRAVDLADRYARSSLPVLIVGETGTGKELIAQRIHRGSGRTGKIVDINCGSLRPELADSLLFGHRRGSFTGAVEATPGLIAQARSGTLFLDELSSLHPLVQASLLRVLEDGEPRRLGDVDKRPVDFRLVAAVQDDFGSALERGEFRRDLYHRLAAVVIHLPPLRERIDDLQVLAAHFAALSGVGLAGDGVRRLVTYDWPGNVRELRALIARAAIGREGGQLDADDIRDALGQTLCHVTDEEVNGDGEAARLRVLCEQAGWDIDLAAERDGVHRSTFYRRLRTHRIRPDLHRGD